MRRMRVAAMAGALAVMMTIACQPEAAQEGTSAGPDSQSAQAEAMIHGRVMETMNSGGYTYVMVRSGGEAIWAAAPEIKVEAGESVTFPKGFPMTNHFSKTLDRTFDQIIFAPFIAVEGREQTGGQQQPGSAPGLQQGMVAGLDLSGIERAEGGKTIGEIFTDKAGLAGQEVTFRGKVVKYSPGIMGKNWLHVKDGTSGPGGANDLTVTTDATAQVGNVVLVRGVVTTDKDFGFGYHYELIIEDAVVTID